LADTDTICDPVRMAAYPIIRQKMLFIDLNTYLPAMLDERGSEHFNGQYRFSIDIEISISTSILFFLRIGIGIDDTFEASIGIEYRQYF